MAVVAFPTGGSRAQPADDAMSLQDRYSVEVTVKGTRPTQSASKKQALAEGKRQAFYQALLELAPEQAREIYRKLRGKPLDRFIKSIKITNEVRKARYYGADVIYHFDKSKLARVIGADRGVRDEAGVPEGEGLLIIPPYDAAGDQLLLFERQNLWRAVLNNAALEIGGGLLVMPFGDPQDDALLTDEVLLTGNKQVLKEMARRYGTRNVVIAQARRRKVEDMPVIEVLLRPAGGSRQDERLLKYKTQDPTETVDVVLRRAARDVASKLNDSLENYSLFGVPPEKRIKHRMVRADYRFGTQWRKILATIESLSQVQHIDIQRLGTTYAILKLSHRGPAAVVKQALEARGLLVNSQRSLWRVGLR